MRARKNFLVLFPWLVALCIGWPCNGFSHGAYHDVVETLTALLAKSPKDAELHLRLAQAHMEHEEWELTLKELSRVDELAPGKHPTRLLRGMAFAGSDRWEAAKTELDAALETEPDNTDALAARARVLLELRQPEKAIADWRKALSFSKKVGAEFFITWAQTLRRHDQLAEAVSAVREGIRRADDDFSLLQLAVELEVAVKDYDSALKRVAALQARWPRPEPWMVRRAEILRSAGRLEQERSVWQEVRRHILALPNLDRSSPYLTEVLARAEDALGTQSPVPVSAPPAALRDKNR